MLICLGTVEGFAAFDPDEKDHILGPALCEVVMKDGEGDVVAKVSFPLPFRPFPATFEYSCRDFRDSY
jgi:hypothetical protein